MQSRKTVLAASLAMVLSIGVASGASALGEDEDPGLAFCQSSGALSQAIESLAALDANSTTEELQASADAVREAASMARFSSALRPRRQCHRSCTSVR